MFTQTILQKNIEKTGRFVFILTCVLLMGYAIKIGPTSGPDTVGYSYWADKLIAYNFNWFELYQNHHTEKASYHGYLLSLTFFAIAKLIGGAQWTWVFLGFNIACIPVLILQVKNLARRVGVQPILLALFPLIYLFSDAYLRWPKGMITDTPFCVLVLFLVSQVFARGDNPTIRQHIIFALSLLAAFFMRPAAPAIMLPMAAIFYLPKLFDWAAAHRHLWLIGLGVILAYLLAYAAIMQINLNGGLQYRQLNYSSRLVGVGNIIHDRPETYLEYTGTYLSAAKILIWRFINFFRFWVAAWSPAHIGINAVFFSVVWAGILLGEIFINRDKVRGTKASRLRVICMAGIAGIALFHTMILIDYGWRYRYPALGLMVLWSLINVNWFIVQRQSKA